MASQHQSYLGISIDITTSRRLERDTIALIFVLIFHIIGIHVLLWASFGWFFEHFAGRSKSTRRQKEKESQKKRIKGHEHGAVYDISLCIDIDWGALLYQRFFWKGGSLLAKAIERRLAHRKSFFALYCLMVFLGLDVF